jgi:tetratricopeptide (TPR) repeat protein
MRLGVGPGIIAPMNLRWVRVWALLLALGQLASGFGPGYCVGIAHAAPARSAAKMPAKVNKDTAAKGAASKGAANKGPAAGKDEAPVAEEEEVLPPVMDPEREAARVVFEGGVKAYQDHRYEEAIELFMRAHQLKPNPAFSFNIGIAYQDLGDLPMALRYYRDYLRQDPGASDRVEVSERIRNLEGRLQVTGLQQLTVLTEPAGAAILIDGQPVGASPWTGELKPGHHSLTVKRQGYRSEERDFDLPTDRAIDVPVTLTKGMEVQAPPARTPVPKLTLPKIAWYRDVRPVTWGVLGVGVASLGVAVMFDFSRGDAQSKAGSERNDDVRAELLDTAESRRTWADAFLLLGLGMTATSGVLMFADVAEQRHFRRQNQASAWAGGCSSDGCMVRYGNVF